MNSKVVLLLLIFLSLSNIFSEPPVFFTGNTDPVSRQLEKMILKAYENSFLNTSDKPLEWNIDIAVSQLEEKIVLLIKVTTPTVKGRQYDINFEFFSAGDYSSKLSLAAFSSIEKMERIYNTLPEILEEIRKEEELLLEQTETDNTTEDEANIETVTEAETEADSDSQQESLSVPESETGASSFADALEGTHIIGTQISPQLLFVPSDSANWAGAGIDVLLHYTFDFEELSIRLGGGLGYFYKHIGSDSDAGEIHIQYSGASIVLIEEYFFTDQIYISLKEEIHFILAGDRDIDGVSADISSGNSLLLQVNGGILFQVAESFVVPLEAGIKIDLGAEDSLPIGLSVCSGVQFTL